MSLFRCCCPQKKNVIQTDNIDSKLIEVQNSPKKVNNMQKRLALSKSENKKQTSNFSQKSAPFFHSDSSNHQQQSKVPFNHMTGDGNNFSVQPSFNDNPMTPTFTGMVNKHFSKTKGQLFQLEHNTEVLYYDTKKDDEFCLRYLINKKNHVQKESKSILNFVLAKKSEKNLQDIQLVLIVPSKVLYQTKYMQIPPNIYPIFTNMRRLQKNNFSNMSSQIIQIVEGDQNCIRTSSFDKIIVMLQGEQNIQAVKNYSRSLTKRYSIEEFMKIWWVLPSFLNLEDITDVLKQTLRKFLINDTVQNVSKFLYYEVFLIRDLNLQPFILVRNKKWNEFKKPDSKKSIKDYQTQICMAIGLLMVQMNESVLPYYKYFLENTLFGMKFFDYIKYKSLLQNQKDNFFKKLIFYNLVTQQTAKILEQNRKMIEYKYENNDHRRFCIKNSSKKKFVAAFGFQESTQTGEGNTPIRQEWDDDLRIEDLHVRKVSWDKQSNDSPDNDLNLIDQEQLDKIILTDLIKIENDQETGNYGQESKQDHKQEEQTGQLDISIFETKQAKKVNYD